MTEFTPWPKTPRWYRDVIVTEKLDGTNACVIIEEKPLGSALSTDANDVTSVLWAIPEQGVPDLEYWVSAQSRNRLITPESDNYGFAAWVRAHAETLVADLGPGRHFGEWWGRGIQRGYGMDCKVFSLFNTVKHGDAEFTTPRLSVVPVLYRGGNLESEIVACLEDLQLGSHAAIPYSGWGHPAEGICIYHTAAGKVFKVTLEDDERPKGTDVWHERHPSKRP